MNLPAGLRHFRKEFSLTQKQVADAIGIRESSYQRYERGTVQPSITVIFDIANAFNVSLDYLVGRTNEPSYYPNALTRATIEAAERGEDMYGPFNTVEEAMEALNAED